MLRAEALTIYRAMLTDPDLGVAGLGQVTGLPEEAVRQALDDLADAELMRVAPGEAGVLTPANPRVALAHLVSVAEGQVADWQRRINATKETLEAIASDFEAAQAQERLVLHTRLDAIQARLEELAQGARTECLSLNPGRAHKPADRAASKPLNQLALERGVRIRAIYQDAFRLDVGTLEYARWLTGLGGEIRTLPRVPQLMVLVDREVALLPRDPADPSQGAIEVHAAGIVGVLSEHFDQLWSVAEAFGERPEPRAAEAPAALTREVLALLATGVTDEAAAHKLGLSARTVRRVMAQAMTTLGAQSRFQAAVEAMRRGWI